MLGWSPIASHAIADEYEFLISRLTQPAGRPSKARKQTRRIQVEIDGDVVSVASDEEARALLDDVRTKANEAAKLAVERAAAAKRRPVRAVIKDAKKALQVPEISVPPSLRDVASQLIGEIRANFTSTLATIEIQALIAKREREIEEDDEEVMLLL